MKKRILIVDDDREFVSKISMLLEGKYKLTIAYSVNEFWERFSPYAFDLVLMDLRLEKEKEGLSLLKYIKSQNESMPVLMVTAYPDLDSAVESMKAGAIDYIQKDKVDIFSLTKIIDALIRESALTSQLGHLSKRVEILEPIEIIGESSAIEEVKQKVKIAARDGKITVLVRGESGTGKELVAKSIHRSGVRRNGPFVKVLIAGLNKETIYSELFGHEAGAFTGALKLKKGYIEEAHKGILFLDEIGDLDKESQIKLLGVLESGTFTRMGSTKEIKVDVQFVAATHRNLEEMIKSGDFRQDLYYRIKAFQIFIPPLRERKSDIPLLADYFLKKAFKDGRTSATSFEDKVIDVFLAYEWPGNVRELKNIVEFAAIQAQSDGSDKITLKHLSKQLMHDMISPLAPPARISGENSDSIEKALAVAELEFVSRGIAKYGTTKMLLAEKLGYSDRFTFRRRIKRIFERHPELREAFPDVAQLFGERKRNR